MIRTEIIRCKLKKDLADALNLNSGRVYNGIVSRHWKLLRQKSLWLSEKSLTKLSDMRLAGKKLPLHAHSIDAAQQGFFDACRTTRALRKKALTTDNDLPAAHFPWRRKRFRTTIWKNTAIKRKGDVLELSNGKNGTKILIHIPKSLLNVASIELSNPIEFKEVRLVFDKKSRHYRWHIVVENGKQPKNAPGINIVSVDLGEIHPAVVGGENEAIIVTGRERRHEAQGHAKRMAKLAKALSTKKKGSRRYRKFLRAKARM